MPRVGLVRYAQVAFEVAEAVLPRYRAPRSKHVFTQPQLLAVLCLMRYDGWTFRDAEVRLAEHAELRRVLRLTRVPDYTTLWRFLARVDPAVFERLLREIDRRFGPPSGPRGVRALLLALDATGLATTSLSTFLVRREYEIKGQVRQRAWWLKWLVVVDLRRQLILAQQAHRAPTNDSRQLPQLLGRPTVRAHRIGWVLADKEFDAERNHEFIHQVLHAQSAIPARAIGRAPRTRYRAQMVHRLPRMYRQRVLVETLFSAAKRTQGGVAPGQRLEMQVRQALLYGVSYNVQRLKPCLRAA